MSESEKHKENSPWTSVEESRRLRCCVRTQRVKKQAQHDLVQAIQVVEAEHRCQVFVIDAQVNVLGGQNLCRNVNSLGRAIEHNDA